MGYTSKAGEIAAGGDEAAGIEDDARRIVSIRIPTSDYGRIKLLAKQLKVKESEVFRFLLRTGLDSLAPLHDSALRDADSVLRVLASVGPEVADYFNLDEQRLRDWAVEATAGTGLKIAPEDLQLIKMMHVSAGFVRTRLETLTGRRIAPESLREALSDYLACKYPGGRT